MCVFILPVNHNLVAFSVAISDIIPTVVADTVPDIVSDTQGLIRHIVLRLDAKGGVRSTVHLFNVSSGL